MAPNQRHSLTQRVSLPNDFAADVTVSGDVAEDAQGLAGYSATLIDLDSERASLAQDALAQASAAQRDASNPILATLDQVQASVDLARILLPPGQRDSNKMLNVAQQFVEAAQQAGARNNWNMVQTLETSADVSLQDAAQPAGQQQALTERFIHKGVKHDITVDPNSADPFATFKDHSKGQDAGNIVQQVVGGVLNVLALVPGVNVVAAPAAAAWDAAQAGESFNQGNAFGGVLNLGEAVGLGLQVAGNSSLGADVFAGTALVGGTAGIVGGAQRGDTLGILAGILTVASAGAAGAGSLGLVSASEQTVVQNLSTVLGIAAGVTGGTNAIEHGDSTGGLLQILQSLGSAIVANSEAIANAVSNVVQPSQVPPIQVTGSKLVFVGGLGDQSIGGDELVHGAFKAYLHPNGDQSVTNPNVQYFSWDQADQLKAYIQANKGDVTVVAHSWGADTVANVVAGGTSVKQLITLDPVSYIRPDLSAVAANSGQWIDLNAVGGRSFNLPNIVAGIGAPWNTGPNGVATIFKNINTDHGGAGQASFITNLPQYNGK